MTSTHRTARAALLGLVLAATFAAGHSTTTDKAEDAATTWVQDTASDTPADCGHVEAERLTDTEVGTLIAQGWYGDPTDGAEWLYRPSC